MLKNRPLMMILTGTLLGLALWVLVQAVQGRQEKQAEPIPPNPNSDNKTVEDYTIAPAGILTASGRGNEFVLSGVGVAGAGLSLQNGENVLAGTKVSPSGAWTFSFKSDHLVDTLVLDLLMATPDGNQIRSDQSLILVNTEQGALILLTAAGANSRVLQSPFESLPQKDGFLVEAIDYDNSGGVIFSGTSSAKGKVRIYANNNLVGESHVDGSGRWSLIFGSIMPLGEYNISAELVADNGSAAIKLTLPFARMAPLFETEGSPKILVQKHDDHIQIGRALYGGGYQYTVVYSDLALSD